MLGKHGLEVELAHQRDPLLLQLGEALRKSADQEPRPEQEDQAEQAARAEAELLAELDQQQPKSRKKKPSPSPVKKHSQACQAIEAGDLAQAVTGALADAKAPLLGLKAL